MTSVRSRKKRWFKVFGLACLVVGVIVLALPVWFPWVLRPALARFGVRFDAYERVGYTRFALTNVSGQFGDARFISKRILGFLPPRWLWRHYASGSDEEPFLTVMAWKLEIQPGEKPQRTGSPDSAFALAETINDKLPAWRTWLPRAQMTDGKIQVGSNEASVATVEWHRGKLSAKGELSKLRDLFVLHCDFSGTPPYRLSIDAKLSGLTNRLELTRATDQWRATGELDWQSNRVALAAGFGRSGWWPERASLTSTNFRVPSKLLPLTGYHDLNGRFVLEWVNGRYHLEASARAMPKVADPAFAPPLELSLLARGDSDSAVLEKLRITSPAIQAELSDHIGLNRSGKLTTESATLRVALDLAKLEGLLFGGKLNGHARIWPMPAGQPSVEFDLAGESLTGRGFAVARAHLAGRLRWPILNLHVAELEFGDGSTLGGAGEIHLESWHVSNGTWQSQGAWARQFLPVGLTYSNLQATGQINGSPGAWLHTGELAVESFSAPHLKPCRLLATWRGENLRFRETNLKLVTATEVLDLAGGVRVGDPAASACDLEMTGLTLTRNAEAIWRLDKPCRIALRRQVSAPDRIPYPWQLQVDGFHWRGQDRGLKLDGDVTWERGQVELSGHGLSFVEVPELISLPVGQTSLNAINLKANWDSGPIEFKLSVQCESPAVEGESFSANIKLTGDANGLVADPLIISSKGAEILHALGKLPLTLIPEPGKVRVRLEENKPFNFQLATERNKPFWDVVSQRFGIRVADPKIAANLQGTLRKVQGTLLAQATQIGRSRATNEALLPTMERLRIDASIEGDNLRLRELAFEIENQPVRITGDLPIQENWFFDFISRGALPEWRRAHARIEIADARIEPFARYLPTGLSPQGRLSVNLGVVPGGELNGELKITGAATRPILFLTPIRDIQATVLLSGRRATISQFIGRMGGREVSLTGHFDFPAPDALAFELGLRADNIPLIYRPGLLLRSDCDIQIARAGGQPATVSGDVTLRDGLFLQDLKSLVPTGRSEPLGRPPYFSVADKPFADWKLNVKVHGDRFMRVRTPYFRGEVSADFQIKGDLEEPQALGEARINSGRVRFPFGTLTVDQGHASLTSDQPYEPQLFATASSRLYGYNIKMELSGTASAPFISFSSTPPLTSERILLMLAAGEVPSDETSFSHERKMGGFALYLGNDIIARWLGNEETADRLTIRSGEDISQEGNSTYYIEYKLTDDWSVIGQYDRFSALNAGLKWRIFSR
jgi:translocation and assembly module TamB